MNTINWQDQVKIGRGATGTASGLLSAHRAISVARDLHEAGRWDGRCTIVIHNAQSGLLSADTHRTANYEWLGGLAALREGQHYEMIQEVTPCTP